MGLPSLSMVVAYRPVVGAELHAGDSVGLLNLLHDLLIRAELVLPCYSDLERKEKPGVFQTKLG